MNGKNGKEKSMYSPVAGPVSDTLLREARREANRSRKKCLEQCNVLCQHGASLKMFSISLVRTLRMSTTCSASAWKVWATRCRRMILTARVSVYQRWNGIAGLLPRPMATDTKGACRKRYRTSPERRGLFREMIRECSTDGCYPAAGFVNWAKGFPKNWTLQPFLKRDGIQKPSGPSVMP